MKTTYKKYDKDQYSIELFNDHEYKDWVLEFSDTQQNIVKFLSFETKELGIADMVESLRSYEVAQDLFNEAEVVSPEHMETGKQADGPTNPSNFKFEMPDLGKLGIDMNQLFGSVDGSKRRGSGNDSKLSTIKDLLEKMGLGDGGIDESDLQEQINEIESRIKTDGFASVFNDAMKHLADMQNEEDLLKGKKDSGRYTSPTPAPKPDENTQFSRDTFFSQAYSLEYLLNYTTKKWDLSITDRSTATKKTLTFVSKDKCVKVFEESKISYEKACSIFSL
jgi:hypothetical protein